MEPPDSTTRDAIRAAQKLMKLIDNDFKKKLSEAIDGKVATNVGTYAEGTPDQCREVVKDMVGDLLYYTEMLEDKIKVYAELLEKNNIDTNSKDVMKAMEANAAEGEADALFYEK